MFFLRELGLIPHKNLQKTLSCRNLLIFLFYDLASAYQEIGNMKKAWEVYEQGKYLYPDADWKDKGEKTKKPQID